MADKVVAPPELAGLYGERPRYLPHSYHIADQASAFVSVHTCAAKNLLCLPFAAFPQICAIHVKG